MMFNKFTVLALVALTVLVASAVGHPTLNSGAGDNGGIEQTNEKQGFRAVLKKIKDKFVKIEENCTQDGWIQKLKTKLGFAKATTTEQPTTVAAEIDYSGYIPVAPEAVVPPQEQPDETYVPDGGEDITILDDSSVNNEFVNSGEVTGYPDQQVDPEIDIRMSP